MRKVTKLTVTDFLFFCFIVLFMILPAWAWGDVSNNQYVVWHDNTTNHGNYDIFFKKSTDGRVTWEEPYQNLTNNDGDSPLWGGISIGVKGMNIYVVWFVNSSTPKNPEGDDEIFFKKTQDGRVAEGKSLWYIRLFRC